MFANFQILVSTKMNLECLLEQTTSKPTTHENTGKKRRKRFFGDSEIPPEILGTTTQGYPEKGERKKQNVDSATTPETSGTAKQGNRGTGKGNEKNRDSATTPATSGTATQGNKGTGKRKEQNRDSATTQRPSEKSSSTLRPSIKPTTATQPKYGCPVGFTKVTEYVCLHYRNDAKGNGLPSTFDASQKYCKDQNKGASLLYFTNHDAEVLKIWKWLGNLQKYFQFSNNIIKMSTQICKPINMFLVH